MLYDSIDNFIKYLPDFAPRAKELLPLLKAVQNFTFEEIKKMDFGTLDLRFSEYDTKSEEEIPFEAHRKHWDMQIILENEEYAGYAPIETLIETIPYNEDNDIAFYSGIGQTFKLGKGMAMLFAPWDAHQPGITIGRTPARIKKIVVKLAWQ